MSKPNILQRLASLRHRYAFVSVAVVFWLAVLLLKLVEMLFFARVESGLWWPLFWRGMVNAVLSSAVVLFPVAVLYWLVGMLSCKSAFILSSLLCCVAVLAETVMMVYLSHNGFLLDAEIFSRPIDEALGAVISAVGYLLPIVGVAIILTLFVLACLWADRRNPSPWFRVAVLAMLIVCTACFRCPGLVAGSRSDAYSVYKTRYLLGDACRYYAQQRTYRAEVRQGGIPYDESLLRQWQSSNPYFCPSDLHYPLLCNDQTPNALGAYFPADSLRRPNVVFVIVESMGAEFLADGYMPFVDSLAHSGLYWPNGLSTAARSYGAVPAVTGSVGGPRGFQFGDIPEHNSLFSILHNAGYHSGTYYAGYFSYDNVARYLERQPGLEMADLYNEFQQRGVDSLGTWWGYHDGLLLQRAAKELAQLPQPYCSLVVTLSMHEDLQTPKSQRISYETQARKVASRPNLHYPQLAQLTGRCAAACYTDDCLRQFFHHLSRQPGFENTIFVLTGDHASGLVADQPIDYYHVPIIIWSPMLSGSRCYRTVVTHNDIVPSLNRMLADNFAVPTPQQVHWLGLGLDTADTINPSRTLLFTNYSGAMRQLLTGGKFYMAKDQWSPEQCYLLDTDMQLHPVKDSASLQSCRNQLKYYRYLYHYTHDGNHLMVSK